MAVALRLEVKQTQKLQMNPQMQQAIALLQLTNLQLTDMLKKEMEQNPFLAFDAAHYQERQGGGKGGAQSGGQSDAPDLTQLAAPAQSLTEHIMRQIATLFADGTARQCAIELTGWLDERGFLRESDGEICATLGVAPDLLQQVLARLQAVEPSGLFARDLADCFAMQLREAGLYDAPYEILLANLDALGGADLAVLAAQCGVDEKRLAEMIMGLRGLTANPAAHYEVDEKSLQKPDIFVQSRKKTGKMIWQAQLNEETLPQVLVLERDWEEMAKRKISDQDRAFMKSHVASARWLKKAAHQRAATMLRVAQAVVAHQQGFMAKGMAGLKPLRLRDIAAMLQIHESTVSRTVAGKLIATPHGVLALKNLFSVELSGDGRAGAGDKGGRNAAGSKVQAMSGAAVRARLAKLIAAEAAGGILSDAKLVDLLAKTGIVVARRTVAKYREQLGIAPSNVRRRAYRLQQSSDG